MCSHIVSGSWVVSLISGDVRPGAFAEGNGLRSIEIRRFFGYLKQVRGEENFGFDIFMETGSPMLDLPAQVASHVA